MAARFSPIMQNGYVVKDLDRAMHHWSEKCGVGPFFVLEHIEFGKVWFRGQPTTIDMSVGIAYWGEMQIELIHQHNDAPSIYTDFTGSRGEGLQHIGVMTDSVERHLGELAGAGIRPTQHGSTATGIQFAYLDTDLHPGAMIELIENGPAINAFFGMAREASRNWNGRDPVRRL